MVAMTTDDLFLLLEIQYRSASPNCTLQQIYGKLSGGIVSLGSSLIDIIASGGAFKKWTIIDMGDMKMFKKWQVLSFSLIESIKLGG